MVKFSTDIVANHSHTVQVNEQGHGRTDVVAGHEHLIVNLEVKEASRSSSERGEGDGTPHTHLIIPTSLRI